MIKKTIMKTRFYFILFALFLTCNTFAQIGIGGVPREGALLDFSQGLNDTKGIVLPIVSLDSINLVYHDGTLLVDRDDKVVKVRWNGRWRKLSDPGSFDPIMVNSQARTTAAILPIDVNAEDLSSKIVIGNQNTSVDGMVVLEASDKALVLPYVEDPHLNIPMPVAGTVCYDTKAKAIAIFDGKVWSYWK
jgi:hypothetical protein